MGLPAGLSSCPKGQDNSGVVNIGTFWPSSLPRIGHWGVRPKTPGHYNVGYFGGHGIPKASQQPGEPEEPPCEGSGRYPPGDRTCSNSRVAGASQGLR